MSGIVLGSPKPPPSPPREVLGEGEQKEVRLLEGSSLQNRKS